MENEPLTRKQKAEKRRLQTVNEIIDIVGKAWEKNKGKDDVFIIGLTAGDNFINAEIIRRPQEKEFLISCGNRAVEILNEAIDKTMNKVQNKIQSKIDQGKYENILQ